MNIKIYAQEALKKFRDGTFIDIDSTCWGNIHLWKQTNNPHWKANWKVSVIGALVLAYMRMNDINKEGNGWWHNEDVESKFIEYKIRAKHLKDYDRETRILIEINNKIYGSMVSDDSSIDTIKTFSNKGLRILTYVAKYGTMNPHGMLQSKI